MDEDERLDDEFLEKEQEATSTMSFEEEAFGDDPITEEESIGEIREAEIESVKAAIAEAIAAAEAEVAAEKSVELEDEEEIDEAVEEAEAAAEEAAEAAEAVEEFVVAEEIEEEEEIEEIEEVVAETEPEELAAEEVEILVDEEETDEGLIEEVDETGLEEETVEESELVATELAEEVTTIDIDDDDISSSLDIMSDTYDEEETEKLSEKEFFYIDMDEDMMDEEQMDDPINLDEDILDFEDEESKIEFGFHSESEDVDVDLGLEELPNEVFYSIGKEEEEEDGFMSRIMKKMQDAGSPVDLERNKKLDGIFEQKQIEFLTGKTITKDIITDTGKVIAKTGDLINVDTIEKAKKNGKLIDVIMNCR
jgi:hypothetical protein